MFKMMHIFDKISVFLAVKLLDGSLVYANHQQFLFFMILYFLEFKQGNAANKEYMDGNRA